MPEKFYSRPRDKSLQAYKDWIQDMTRRLNPNAEDTMTDEEWIDGWKKFWAKVDSVSESQKSSDA